MQEIIFSTLFLGTSLGQGVYIFFLNVNVLSVLRSIYMGQARQF